MKKNRELAEGIARLRKTTLTVMSHKYNRIAKPRQFRPIYSATEDQTYSVNSRTYYCSIIRQMYGSLKQAFQIKDVK